VREKLRKEVNFGCPVINCGLPYLEYHHFDPPWKEKNHYEPKGMVALCPTDHSLASGSGKWDKEQIRYMKKNSYIKDKLEVNNNFVFIHHITSPPLAMMLPVMIFSIVFLWSFNTPFSLIFFCNEIRLLRDIPNLRESLGLISSIFSSKFS